MYECVYIQVCKCIYAYVSVCVYINIWQEDSRAGQEDSRTGQENSRAGQEDSRAGQEDSRAGQEDSRAGQEDIECKLLQPQQGLPPRLQEQLPLQVCVYLSMFVYIYVCRHLRLGMSMFRTGQGAADQGRRKPRASY